MDQRQTVKEVSQIVRRNVRQVIDTLMVKGLDYQQILVDQFLNGQKSQYEFLLPKSKHHGYFTNELNSLISKERERKSPKIEKQENQISHSNQKNQENHLENVFYQPQYHQQIAHANHPNILTAVGRVEEVSVGAMCQLIKQLRQSKEPYEPFDNEVYEQQLALNLEDENLCNKVEDILQMIRLMKDPLKSVVKSQSPEKNQSNNQNKMDLLRSEFGTERDGSLGTWGGKKYEGLGMRDQFTSYRKQTSKNFYQNFPR